MGKESRWVESDRDPMLPPGLQATSRFPQPGLSMAGSQQQARMAPALGLIFQPSLALREAVNISLRAQRS